VLAAQSNDLTVVVGADRVITYASPSFERVLGLAPAQLTGVRVDALVHPDDLDALLVDLARAAQVPDTVVLPDCRVRRAGEAWRIVRGVAANHTTDPAIGGIVVTIRDVTDHEVLVQSLRNRAGVDPVTGLCNRSRFRDALCAALQEASNRGVCVALLLIDLEGVSSTVLSAGFEFADAALRDAVARLGPLCRSMDTLARLGDAQFALVMPGTRLASALWAARKTLAALATPATVGSTTVPLRPAVGIALYPEDGGDVDMLLRSATVALAAAKQSPEGFSSYSSAQAQLIAQRNALSEPLRHAVERNELVLYYQPQVDLRQGRGRVIGVEALVRWCHPERGLIMPNQFIGLAEQQGLIDGITQWTMSAAFAQCRLWQNIGLNLTMAVNLSMRSLLDPRLPAGVELLLRQSGLSPRTVVLEVTESALMVDKERTLASLKKIAALGVRLSVDDFGTGYSSFEYLRTMPVSEIKIDQSIVRQAHGVDQDRAIVESVIALGHRLGLVVVAEGVEDHRTLRLLRDLGCDTIQGFYFSRPLPAPEFKQWLDVSPWGMQQVLG
jgi:diguanylate cyclase (GGDEF)-like protein/PAS domain S-box-containing protein